MKVIQIYFDESQRSGLDYIPFRNDDCTVYFENSVIRRLVESGEHVGHDYFGVVSHQLRSKVEFIRQWRHGLANFSTRSFSPEAFQAELQRLGPDAMSFQTHLAHDPVSVADGYHPGFAHFFQRIMTAIGYRWTPTVFQHVFYFNYFVARASIYERYVKEMLAPAMDVMEQMPALMQNSHYPRPLAPHLQARFGIPFYPYHPFLCERFFSFFAHVHRLDCAHY